MIYIYPNFQCIPVNPITDRYDNEYIISETTDNGSEYKHSKGVKENIFLEDEVNIHDPLEDKYLIQEMVEDDYHQYDPKIISEESDDEVE